MRESKALFQLLKKTGTKLVLAESCTGGGAASLLTEIPGVSEHFCGSFVVYREHAKTRWLGVSPKTLKTHGDVSAPVALEMAKNALHKTPEANLSLSITGHLGPQAPKDLEGVAFIGWAHRTKSAIQQGWIEIEIPADAGGMRDALQRRKIRKLWASHALLRVVRVLVMRFGGLKR